MEKNVPRNLPLMIGFDDLDRNSVRIESKLPPRYEKSGLTATINHGIDFCQAEFSGSHGGR